MNSLTANVKNEIERMWVRRTTKGFALLAIVIPVLTALLLVFMRDSAGFPGGFGGNLPMLMLGLFTFALLPLFLFMSAADLFAGEAASRTLKLTLVRPVTRAKVFASKVAAIAFYTVVLLVLLWIVSTVSGLFVPGAGITNGLADSLKAYAAAFVPMLAIGLVAVFIAQWFRSGTGVMALCVCLYAAGKLLPFFVPQADVWSLYSYTSWHLLWIGGGTSFAKLFNSFVVLLSSCIIGYMAGWIAFERKQL